jgi:F420-0:gamma-glutamyl ligase-like protein
MVYPKFETHDIVYLDASPFSYSKLNFIDESGVKESIANIMIPWTAEVFMFGNELSQVVDLNINKVTNVYWSN